MVTVVKRPQGHKIIDQAIQAAITNSSGDALITFPYHGLATSDTVYILSNIEDYNGFWYVTAVDANSFKISEHVAADFVEYAQDLDIEYYQTQEHDWNSIFLPIVYKLTNDRWPTNSVDSSRTILSFSNDNGYTTIVPSGPLKLGFEALEYVKISGSMDPEVNGVWQMMEVSPITINLPYNAANDLVGATVQYYYNNYQAKVKVYGGLNFSHPWQSRKPYTEVAELSLTPDENNEVMFSVADYIRGKTAVKNNTLIASYPLNLDAFTGFYIATAESYDNSDGYTVGTEESAFTDDSFQGYAVTGKLPFKNTYGGDYADYIFTSGSPALWLTLTSRLLAVEGRYFDISFIKNNPGAFTVTINKYVGDYLTDTEVVPYTDQGIGVYRIPIEVSSVYDYYCIYVTVEGAITTGDLDLVSDWVNGGGAEPGTWDFASFNYPAISINGNGGPSGYTVGETVTAAGTYQFTTLVNIEAAGANPLDMTLTWALLDASFNELDTIVFNYNTYGYKLETFLLSTPSAGAYLGLKAINDTVVDTKTLTVRYATLGQASQSLLNPEFVDSSVWTNEGAGTSWAIVGGELTLNLGSGNSKQFTQLLSGLGQGNVQLISERTLTGITFPTDSINLGYQLYDEDNNLISSTVDFGTGNNTIPISHGFQTSVGVAKIVILGSINSGSDINVAIPFVWLFAPLGSGTVVSGQITEEICIDIIEPCEPSTGGGATPIPPPEIGDFRLLEDSAFRLLEDGFRRLLE